MLFQNAKHDFKADRAGRLLPRGRWIVGHWRQAGGFQLSAQLAGHIFSSTRRNLRPGIRFTGLVPPLVMPDRHPIPPCPFGSKDIFGHPLEGSHLA
jgi:hypothetical protein